MSSAGQELVAGRIPGERISTTVTTASSTTITTTETVVVTHTADLVSGRTYRVTCDLGYQVSVATDHHYARIREDTSAGTQLQGRRITGPTTAQTYVVHLEAEYTAAATGTKTFVITLVRSGGTGNSNLNASATSPTYTYVDYIRG